MRTIQQIDRNIDGITALLERLETIDPMSAEFWQDAWDNHPDLSVQNDALYLERGIAQQARDEAAEVVYRRDRRAARRQISKSALKKCPTCGSLALAA